MGLIQHKRQTNEKASMVAHTCNGTTGKAEAERLEVQGHPWLHNGFKAILGCTRPSRGVQGNKKMKMPEEEPKWRKKNQLEGRKGMEEELWGKGRNGNKLQWHVCMKVSWWNPWLDMLCLPSVYKELPIGKLPIGSTPVVTWALMLTTAAWWHC